MIEKRMMVALVGALLLFSACVSQEKKPSAVDVLNRSISAMENVSTYSFDVKSSTFFVGNSSVLGGGNQRMDIMWGGETDEQNHRMHVNMTVVSPGMNLDMEQYIIDDIQYVKIPMLGWVMNRTGQGYWQRQDYSRSRLNLSKIDAKLFSDEMLDGVSYYFIDVNMSPRDMADLMNRQMQSGQPTEEEVAAIRSVGFQEWIAKDTFLVRRRVMRMHLVNNVTTADVNMTMNFFDYGRPMEIQLPAEAENALDVNQLMPGG